MTFLNLTSGMFFIGTSVFGWTVSSKKNYRQGYHEFIRKSNRLLLISECTSWNYNFNLFSRLNENCFHCVALFHFCNASEWWLLLPNKFRWLWVCSVQFGMVQFIALYWTSIWFVVVCLDVYQPISPSVWRFATAFFFNSAKSQTRRVNIYNKNVEKIACSVVLWNKEVTRSVRRRLLLWLLWKSNIAKIMWVAFELWNCFFFRFTKSMSVPCDL